MIADIELLKEVLVSMINTDVRRRLPKPLDFDYASPNGKNIIMRISYFDALS